MTVIELSSGRWRVQVRRRGFPTIDRTVATREEALGIEKLAIPPKGLSQQRHTLREAWLLYSVSREFRDKPENTRRTESTRMKHVLAGLGDYSLANLVEHPEIIADWLDKRTLEVSERTGSTPSKTSIRLEIAALSTLGLWAVTRHMVTKNPAKGIQRPGLQKRKRRVPVAETAGISGAACSDDVKLAEAARFALLCRELGCRPGELAGLIRSDVEMGKSQSLFRNTKDPDVPGGRDRMVHMTSDAIMLTDVQLRYAMETFPDSAFVFTTRGRDGKYHGFDYAQVAIRLREAEAVGTSFHVHALRREFVSRAIENGIPLSTIMKQTGHRSLQAVSIYDEGLSTAPDIRAALDAHAKIVHDELDLAILERHFKELGATPVQIEHYMATLLASRGKGPAPMQRVLITGEKLSMMSRPPDKR